MLIFGAPKIKQSENGREFVISVVNELKYLWPECVIVHGHPKHPQSQRIIERTYQDVEHMLRACMADNKSKSEALDLILSNSKKIVNFIKQLAVALIKVYLEIT